MTSPFFELLKKEIRRFMIIWVQTIIGPVITALLYQLIFGQNLSSLTSGVPGVSYATFLIPGLVMMQVLLNSFGNSSSSLIQAKYTANIVFILMAPISPAQIYAGYLFSSIIRGIVVGIAVMASIAWFGVCIPLAPIAMVYFLVMGAAIMSGIGIIAGVLCQKFDELAGFQSFIIVPLIYLAGIFYNASHIPGVWHYLALADPFLYIIDGFRYGFIAHSSYNIVHGALFVFIFTVAVNFVGYWLIKKGIRIKN